MGNTATLKDQRFEAKLSKGTKDTIAHAAELCGQTMSDFVIGVAYRSAQEVIANHNVIQFSVEGQKSFAEHLINPPAQPKELTDALKWYNDQKRGTPRY